MLKINFLHICEYAFFSEDKKLNIIGIFNGISTKGFPAGHPRFSIVINFYGDVPESGLSLEILLPNKNLLISIPINKKSDWDGEKNTNLVFNLLNTVFAVEGNYEVRVMLNGEKISPEQNYLISVNKT